MSEKLSILDVLGEFMEAYIKKQKGFTLLEVIVSMAIIAVLAVAFVPLFSTSFAGIFSYGEKDKAMSLASDKMELLYAGQPLDLDLSSEEDIGELESDLGGDFFEPGDETIYEYSGSDIHFTIESSFKPIEDENIEGYRVTVVSFYKNGERHVELTSFVR